jgi:hypothetical protein
MPAGSGGHAAEPVAGKRCCAGGARGLPAGAGEDAFAAAYPPPAWAPAATRVAHRKAVRAAVSRRRRAAARRAEQHLLDGDALHPVGGAGEGRIEALQEVRRREQPGDEAVVFGGVGARQSRRPFTAPGGRQPAGGARSTGGRRRGRERATRAPGLRRRGSPATRRRPAGSLPRRAYSASEAERSTRSAACAGSRKLLDMRFAGRLPAASRRAAGRASGRCAKGDGRRRCGLPAGGERLPFAGALPDRCRRGSQHRRAADSADELPPRRAARTAAGAPGPRRAAVGDEVLPNLHADLPSRDSVSQDPVLLPDGGKGPSPTALADRDACRRPVVVTANRLAAARGDGQGLSTAPCRLSKRSPRTASKRPGAAASAPPVDVERQRRTC